ncbi:GUN4 domain-containing protein, partial [Oscillatoriales cyanobacterium LEGE 11467]
DMGVDYRKLRDLLAAQNYKEADGETRHLMVSIIRVMERDYDSTQTFEQFPCTDLRTIDRLWVQYSEGRFGFSIQKPIYDEVGQSYEALGDRVGWRQEGEWLNYHELTFNGTAPSGHLPRVLWVKVFGYCGWEPSVLARKLASCNF